MEVKTTEASFFSQNFFFCFPQRDLRVLFLRAKIQTKPAAFTKVSHDKKNKNTNAALRILSKTSHTKPGSIVWARNKQPTEPNEAPAGRCSVHPLISLLKNLILKTIPFKRRPYLLRMALIALIYHNDDWKVFCFVFLRRLAVVCAITLGWFSHNRTSEKSLCRLCSEHQVWKLRTATAKERRWWRKATRKGD